MTLLKASPSVALERVEHHTVGQALRFRAYGMGIAEINVQIFNLSGRSVFISPWQQGVELDWHADALANGVYLYVISVRGWDGSLVRSRVQKLVILR
jgi:hypothetical protein